MELNLPSPIEEINLKSFAEAELSVYLKRDDLIHPTISGNKWRKLKLNIEKYKTGKYEAILTFGGAYSNHIRALAALGNAMGIPTIGIIRGEELTVQSNDTLVKCHEDGMRLEFVTREEYSWRYEKAYKHQLRSRYGNVLVVEEGGANFHGVMGCTEIVSEVNIKPDYFMLASGTGTTAAGILFATEANVVSVPVFKKGDFIRDEIRDLLYYTGIDDDEIKESLDRLSLATDYHFGGYGKWSDELITFMNELFNGTGIKTDQIYTGKMLFALNDLAKKGHFKRGSKIVAIHTGGLQGTNSISDRLVY